MGEQAAQGRESVASGRDGVVKRKRLKREEQATKKAVALAYEQGKGAPAVVAKGRGKIAERLIETARAYGVPIREDRVLIEVLETLEIGEEIPPEIYRAVAEILVAVYRAEKKSG